MFFFLSKTLNYLTMPLVIVLVLLVTSALLRPSVWKRRFYFGGLFLLLFFTNDFIANEIMRSWEVPPTPFQGMKKHTWGILLSGVTKSEMQPSDRVYFQRGADRVIHTLQLYKQGLIRKILISGGSGRLMDIGQREADELKSVLVVMGIPPGDILTENKSRNTHESALAVKSILQPLTRPEDCLLITSAFHMRRSQACFVKAGWPATAFSTDFLSHRRVFTLDVLVIPKLDALELWHTMVKEWVGYVAYAVVGYI
jgi:uncharacterized SAM-binding protein YcdF (DUF218 family)